VRTPAPAFWSALAVIVLVTGAGVIVHRSIDSQDLEVERTRNASQTARFEGVLAAALAETRAIAVEAAYGDFVAAATRYANAEGSLGFVLTRGADVERVVGPNDDREALRAAAGTSIAREARAAAIADGDVHVVAPVVFDGAPAIAFVAPGYEGTAPSDVAARRRANPAVVLGIVRFDDLRFPDEQPPLWPSAAVRLTTNQGAIGPAVVDPVSEAEARVGDSVWQLAIGRSGGGSPIAGFVVFGVGLAVAAIVFAAVRRQHEHRRQVEAEIGVRSRQLQLIAGTSSALQESLDLAEVLPAFAVDVSDEFGLACMSVHLSNDDGQLLEIFRYGRSADGGDPHFIDLRRRWRTVGQLEVHPRRPLDDVSLQSLQAVADLLAIAVTNSQLFEREQQAVTRLSELDALKNAFLSTVSHELRTATTAVQGFSDLLSEHWETLPDERRREMAERIRRQSGSLRHLVDDLLDYARLEVERLRVNPREVALSEIVEHLTDSFSPLVSSHQLEVHLEDDLRAWVDPIAVERILANLLSNAGKYAPPGTTVTVSTSLHDGCARLSVADQGPGIPAEERRRVFVRFYRLDNAETISTHGAGIGLAILNDFATRSGAKVVIDDAPGGGALVHVDFPTEPIPALIGEPA
jgi:signal transduction histidine kinase